MGLILLCNTCFETLRTWDGMGLLAQATRCSVAFTGYLLSQKAFSNCFGHFDGIYLIIGEFVALYSYIIVCNTQKSLLSTWTLDSTFAFLMPNGIQPCNHQAMGSVALWWVKMASSITSIKKKM